MNEEEVRMYANEKLSELMELDHLATSQQQRREFKSAREYLERAVKTGSDTALKLGSYHLAVITLHVSEVQEGKRKGEQRARRKESNNGSLG